MSNITSPVIQNNRSCNYYFELKNSTTIHIVISAILLCGALIAFLCVAAPVSYILSGALLGLGLLIALIGVILGIKKITPMISSKEQVFPQELVNRIRAHYPKFVSDFVSEAKPNLKDLISFIDLLNQLHSEVGSSTNYNVSEELQQKIDTFEGIARLKNEVRTASLKRLESAASSRPLFPSLPNILQKVFPFFWLGEFISAGSKVVELHRVKKIGGSLEEDLSDYIKPEMLPTYWLIPLDFRPTNSSILNLHTLVLARVLTRDVFQHLKYAALNGEWNLNHSDLNTMKQQLFAKYHAAYQSYKHLSQPSLQEDEFYNLLLCIFKHRYSWKQMSLIKTVPADLWENLCCLTLDHTGRPQDMEFASLIGTLYTQGLIHKESEAFLSSLTLLSLDQFKTIRRQSTNIAMFLENLATHNSTFRSLPPITVHPLKRSVFSQPEEDESSLLIG
ncbi:DUF1389 domain-containing protein [Chlamydia pneumoniae]|uniref:DUF1389 domain-containing protein n=1 Tax=Chlamydia pneumoniae TaxID=83558 RepID=UPI00388E30F5